uniref:EF-hand domain-containing protein n=1 Tax=Hemiselmis andersenii TaxID=464988 RepID=A0A6T8PRA0_HEMAN|mmetsp:Transcript_22538/g.52325  ORF Transcript_22538/g.52325 Transcript_22538/m.52325 type:complete len:160 (+) Transcript_22538:76-555(+)
MAAMKKDEEDDWGANVARHDDEKGLRSQVEAIFRMLDSDHDGYVSAQEASRIGRLLGIAIPERHTAHIKGVSMAQFQGWISSLAKSRDGETEVMRFFTFMKDRKGFITRERLFEWLQANQIQLSHHELDELMDMINSTDDVRGICYDDLRNFYEHYRAR